SRAFERDLVRQERAHERDRLRADRAAERARIGEERESARRQKQEAKAAQLAEWRLEVDEHSARDRELLRIGNESPEVEARGDLYAELQEPRTFEVPAFVPPEAAVPQWSRFRALEKTRTSEVEVRANGFKPQ